MFLVRGSGGDPDAYLRGGVPGFSYGFRPERGQHDALDAGASLPMRMAASWFGSLEGPPHTRLRRVDTRPIASSPLIISTAAD
jgi:hypothetical protein